MVSVVEKYYLHTGCILSCVTPTFVWKHPHFEWVGEILAPSKCFQSGLIQSSKGWRSSADTCMVLVEMIRLERSETQWLGVFKVFQITQSEGSSMSKPAISIKAKLYRQNIFERKHEVLAQEQSSSAVPRCRCCRTSTVCPMAWDKEKSMPVPSLLERGRRNVPAVKDSHFTCVKGVERRALLHLCTNVGFNSHVLSVETGEI